MIDYPEKLENIFVYVSENEEGEGILGMNMPINGLNTFMPFVCGTEQMMETLKDSAKRIGKMGNKKVKLLKFTCREVVEEYLENDSR